MEEYIFEEKKLDIKVLYVEDELPIREAITELLYRRVGCLLTATNGVEGLEVFLREKPEIVISDIRMPQMSGIDMCRQIKEAAPATKIIITSAHSDTNYFLEAIKIGINEYVFKPIMRDKLFTALENSAKGIFMQRELDNQMKTITQLYGAIEQCQSLVAITDKNLKIKYVNPKFMAITGYSPDDFSQNNGGCTLETLCDFDSNPELKRVIESDKLWRGEFTIKHKSGTSVPLFGSLCPVIDNTSTVTSYIKVGEDISDLKQMAAALADREDKLRNLIEKLGEGIAVLDLSFDFVFCNKAMEDIFVSKQLLGQNLNRFLTGGEDLQKVIDVSKNLNVGEKVQIDLSVKTLSGDTKYLSATITPQLDAKKDSITGLFCIFKDITRMKELIAETQKAREAAEKAYLTIEEKNKELREINSRVKASEAKQYELNEILMEYIKATGK